MIDTRLHLGLNGRPACGAQSTIMTRSRLDATCQACWQATRPRDVPTTQPPPVGSELPRRVEA